MVLLERYQDIVKGRHTDWMNPLRFSSLNGTDSRRRIKANINYFLKLHTQMIFSVKYHLQDIIY